MGFEKGEKRSGIQEREIRIGGEGQGRPKGRRGVRDSGGWRDRDKEM